MIGLLDGDIFVHRIGYTTEQDTFDVAKWRMDVLVNNTLDEIGASDWELYLTDSENNFRKQIDPTYHSQRKQAKPTWYDGLKEYLITRWDAWIATGQEADDALGISQIKQAKLQCPTIICSIDKDLKQIPGRHYNFVKKEQFEVTPQEGIKYFYSQLLTGDVVDGITGVAGIGKVKAEKLLKHADTEYDLFQICLKAYRSTTWEGKDPDAQMLMYGRLLKIRQVEEELWEFPKQELQSTEPL